MGLVTKETSSSSKLLELKGLSTRFHTERGVVHAVNDVSYSMNEGEILGIVGESGCGKTVHALSILRLIPIPPGEIKDGEIYFQGEEILRKTEQEMRRIRGGQIAMIFQDPMTSLNPVMTIGHQITESIILHLSWDEHDARERAAELLSMTGIPGAKSRLDDYPHHFSGGMRQRAMIAMALSCNPKLLIADEPTTALDVTIQAQIIDLVKQIQERLNMAIIWITHDLGVTARLAERVNVMYAGRLVETGSVTEVYRNPHHPYTVGLLASLPNPLEEHKKLFSIPGEPPDLIGEQKGCPFFPRCNYAVERCNNESPFLELIEENHSVACWEKERVKKL